MVERWLSAATNLCPMVLAALSNGQSKGQYLEKS
jgi:hypothetical protein